MKNAIVKLYRRRLAVAALLLVVLTFAAYAPVAGNRFVDLDDYSYILDNVNVKEGLSWGGVRWAFQAAILSNWHPLTWISHQLDVSLFGLNPAGHHLMSVGIHAVSSVLLLLALKALTGLFAPSLAVAALFAVHPLHVESVAWASERKDVLSGLLWTLNLLAYVGYARKPSWGRYALLLCCFGAGLMAKPMLVSLPLVLVVLDWWPLARISTAPGGRRRATRPVAAVSPVRLLAEKAPLFVMAAASGWMTYAIQKAAASTALNEVIPLSGRLANAVTSYLVYAVTMCVPRGLSALYRFPEGGVAWWKLTAATCFLAAATAFALARARRYPYVAAGWFWYLITAIPVIGIVQVGMQARADRYTYIPMTGLFLIVAWGASTLAGRGGRARRVVGISVLVVIPLLAALSFRQLGVWRTSESLYIDVVRKDPGHWQAWNALGQALWIEGKVAQAVPAYREALRLRPGDGDTRYNLSIALYQLGRTEEARALFRESNDGNVDFRADTNYYTGLTMYQAGDKTAAVAYLREALRIKPNFPEAEAALGKILSGGKP